MFRLPGFRFRWPPRVDAFHWFDPATTSTFKTRMRVVWLWQNWPPGWVELDDVWCRPGDWPRPVIERSRVTQVRMTRDGRRTGFQFDSPDGRYAGIVLYPSDPLEAVTAFTRHRWPTS